MSWWDSLRSKDVSWNSQSLTPNIWNWHPTFVMSIHFQQLSFLNSRKNKIHQIFDASTLGKPSNKGHKGAFRVCPKTDPSKNGPRNLSHELATWAAEDKSPEGRTNSAGGAKGSWRRWKNEACVTIRKRDKDGFGNMFFFRIVGNIES